jgi:hypothetical protein
MKGERVMKKKMSVTLLAATFAMGMMAFQAAPAAADDVEVSEIPVAVGVNDSAAAAANDKSTALSDVEAEKGGQVAGDDATKIENEAEEGSQIAGDDATRNEAENGSQVAGKDATSIEIEKEDNSLNIDNVAVNASLLGAAVSDNTVDTSGAGGSVTTGNNRINNSLGGATGITQVGQQSGINSLQQQNVNVQANMNFGL